MNRLDIEMEIESDQDQEIINYYQDDDLIQNNQLDYFVIYQTIEEIYDYTDNNNITQFIDPYYFFINKDGLNITKKILQKVLLVYLLLLLINEQSNQDLLIVFMGYLIINKNINIINKKTLINFKLIKNRF